MNCLIRNARSLLSQIALRYKAPATRWCYDHGHAVSRRLMQDLGLIRGSAHIRPASRTYPRSFVLRWYHEPRKVAVATAITLSAAAIAAAACSGYDREIVPCTYRSHIVRCSHQEERRRADACFAEYKAELAAKNMIVDDPGDPRVGRVRPIAERLIHAAHRGLGIYDSSDAPMLRVTERRRRWGRKAPPDAGHLPGIKWEVTLVNDPHPNAAVTSSGQIMVTTGLFQLPDEEIAATLAHGVGQVIARQCADITNIHWLPHGIFSRRMRIEADYIGILLLAVAGFHPQWALVFTEKQAKFERFPIRHPNRKNRTQLLSEAQTMKEALELYREATAMDKVTDTYFR